MSQPLDAWSVLRKLFWKDVLLVLGVIVLARLLSFAVRRNRAKHGDFIQQPSGKWVRK